MKIVLLHLSDLHIHNQNTTILSRVEKICATLNDLLPNTAGVFIAVTGDIAYSGSAEEYRHAKIFFNSLIACIRSKTSADFLIYPIFVPGNHDGEFKNPNGARSTLVQSIQNGHSAIQIDDSIIQICTAPQKNFFEFENEFESGHLTSSDQLWKQHDVTLAGKTISFSAINASWLSTVPENQGKLVFPISNYQDKIKCKSDLRIALIHHPLNWYSQSSYHPLRELCRSHFHIVMSGHEHVSTTSLVTDIELGDSVLMLEAGALCSHDANESSKFSVITLDLDAERFAKVDFQWSSGRYIPAQGEAIWDSFISVPKKKNDRFIMTDEIKEFLEDIGANFTHQSKEKITLSDIYVYPDLQDLDARSSGSETVNAQVLGTQIHKIRKAIVRGDEQYGKTSLLHHLYNKYSNSGYVPLLLNGKDFLNATEEQVRRRIHSAVSSQYGENSVNEFAQLESTSKILLVDDLDRDGAHPNEIAKALDFISRNFEFAIITVGERFEVTELSSTKAAEATVAFNVFRLLGFGFKLRGELIKKWFAIGSEYSPIDLQNHLHDAETIINSVIGKGLVPTTAFNIQVLLQSLEVGAKGTLANAGMAQYYEFLIRKSLIRARLKGHDFDEIFSYLAHLAWFFYEKKTSTLDENSLRGFNSYFSNEIQTTEFVERMEFLIKCRVLYRTGDAYSFRYPYIKYFFVAKHIANNLEDNPVMQDLVKNACQHLYLKENANIVLFLTHHAPNKWIILEVSKVLKQLLSSIQPFDIKRDTSVLNSWVSKAANLIVDTSNIENNRSEQRALEDRSSALPEVEHKNQVESLGNLDFISQLNLLFKTCEILGQILKNKYGSLDKALKQELMKELFDGPLRGINFFLSYLNESPEALIEAIGRNFMEKKPGLKEEEAKRIAQNLIFLTLSSFADGVLSRQGEIIGSPKLKEAIDTVANEESKPTNKLIAIAAQLSYPGNAPISYVEAFADKMKDNVFGLRLLQGVVARHLYMFELAFDQRQRLASAANISVREQTSIAFRSQEKKHLPGKKYKPNKSKGLLGRLHHAFYAQNQEAIEKTLAKEDKVKKLPNLVEVKKDE
ncbi:metallophosphoesterase [Undibacterium danionis]|uniref:Metallophosphoesterase n=1 Tax=Undibacterium danionis TaxID=1812100 RepID=A0ABV6IF00_9BURK